MNQSHLVQITGSAYFGPLFSLHPTSTHDNVPLARLLSSFPYRRTRIAYRR